jgi:hypothetical protein
MSQPPRRDQDWVQEAFRAWKGRLQPSEDFDQRLAQRFDTAQKDSRTFAPSAQDVLGGFFSEVLGLLLGEGEPGPDDPPDEEG